MVKRVRSVVAVMELSPKMGRAYAMNLYVHGVGGDSVGHCLIPATPVFNR